MTRMGFQPARISMTTFMTTFHTRTPCNAQKHVVKKVVIILTKEPPEADKCGTSEGFPTVRRMGLEPIYVIP